MHAINPGDPMAMRNYTQRYQYDSVGNILEMQHQAAGNNWTRNYTIRSHNNRLIQNTGLGSETISTIRTMPKQALSPLPHLEEMGWNFRKNWCEPSDRNATTVVVPETTYYQYEGQGQRIRKDNGESGWRRELRPLKKKNAFI